MLGCTPAELSRANIIDVSANHINFGTRVVGITTELAQYLEQYLAIRGLESGPLFLSQKGGFSSNTRGSFTQNTMQQLIRRLHTEAGIDGRGMSGRKCYALRLIASGKSVHEVAAALHITPAGALRYFETDPASNLQGK